MAESTIEPIRIFILDPYTLIRAGIRLILENEHGMKVVGDEGESTTGLDKIAIQKPDIILLKLGSGSEPGIEIIPRIFKACEHARVILMTTTDNFSLISQAIQKGVLGIVPKNHPPQTLVKAIKKVHAGEVWIEHSLMAQFLNTMALSNRGPAGEPESEPISKLSKRERQVIKLIGMGLKNKQIASQLGISEVTVRHHLTSIFSKLGVSDRLELLVFSQHHGLVEKQEGL